MIVRHRQLRQPREVNHLRRRQRVQLELGIARLDRAEQILVPGQRQIGIVAALHQHLHAADGDGLVDLAEQLLEAEDVAVRRADLAVERAEVALGDADVGVVDVAIDDVGDEPVGVLARADAVGERPSSDVGAWRYSSSASSAVTRPPARTLSAICSIIVYAGSICHQPRQNSSTSDRSIRAARGRLRRRSGRTSAAPRARRRPGQYRILSRR